MIRLLPIALLLLAGCLCPAIAQNFPTPFTAAHSSAGAPIVEFNFDIGDTIFDDPSISHALVYRYEQETNWNSAPMSLLYEACDVLTMSSQIPYAPTPQMMEWYYRSENDTAVVTESPKNVADAFPPPVYLTADLGADPVGDAQGAAGSFLDIVHCYGSYSDTKLYFRLENNGGGFPTSQGFFTYFAYSVGVIDPDATDGAAYALVYANVPLLLSPGLYRINPEDSSFSNIGSIQTQISGNSLYMSCNIADLTSQPGWSSWPPPSGFVAIAPVTGTQDLTEMTDNDIGKAALFLPQSRVLDYASNSTPSLSTPSVSLVEPDTIAAEVTFTDTDDNLPIVRIFEWEGTEHDMTACIKDYATGSVFEKELVVTESGWYRYRFLFSDGVDTVVTMLDSIQVDLSSYLPGDADGNELVNISDVVYLIAYIFSGGPAPDPLEAGDADCNGLVNISDAVYLVAYIFGGGPPPCE